MNILEVRKMGKTLKGKTLLEDIDFRFEGEKIYGIVGDNGAGKSMMFRVLAGLVHPTEGEVLYNGKKFTEQKVKIGLLIDDLSLFPEFTGQKNLALLAGINHYIGKDEIGEAMERVGLDREEKRTFKKYSLGMSQRLLLAQAIMEKPYFLFLDEPTNSIDKEGVKLFYRVIREEAERGAVVVVSSHINSDIRALASEVYLMEAGRLSRM